VGLTYRDAGVDIAAGDELVERIKPLGAKTHRPEVLSGIGGFGGLFEVPKRYKDPILVSGTDGVGTKLRVAFEAGRHSTIGIDLVAMSVNDVLTSGAEPLFFLDYFSTSKLKVAEAESVIAGIARGCEEAGCTLLGGETAELPGFYARGEYDLAGFCVGVVERTRIIDGRSIQPGDALIGLASSGLHSNGYSLARKVLLQKQRHALSEILPPLRRSLADELLEPTRIYVRDILAVREQVELKGLAHITGGGIPGNLPRCLPTGTSALLSERTWQRPPVFDLIASGAEIDRAEMYATFNMGLGMIAVVGKSDTAKALRLLNSLGATASEVGSVERSTREPCAIIEP